MWALILGGVKKFGGWIAAALSFLFALAVVWFSAKKTGRAEGDAAAANTAAADREAIATRTVNEERAASDRANETVERSTDVQSRNAAVDDAAIADKLRDWQRD